MENLNVSAEDDLSDNEDFISRGRFIILPQIKRVIETPMKIQEISQFLACATVNRSTLSGNILLGAEDDKEVAGPSVDIPSRRNKGSKVNVFL